MFGVDPSEQNGPSLQQMRIDAVRNNIEALRGQITRNEVSSLFHSAKALAKDVLELDTVASTVFAMRFGSVILTHVTSVEEEEIQYNDGTSTITQTNDPSTLGRSISLYLQNHFNPHGERKGRPQLIKALDDKFRSAGITADYLSQISEKSEDIAQAVGKDRDALSLELLLEKGNQFLQKPSFILNENQYPQFLNEVSIWVDQEFETVLDRIVTGEYLAEQEKI